jgi:C-1 hydroxylase
VNRRLLLAIRDDVIAAWNRHDPDGILAPVADDVIVRDVAHRMPYLGRAALREATEGFIAAFPDVHLEITSTTAEGVRVAQEWTMTGTHLGGFMGVAPTGRWSQTFGATVTTFDDDGRVIEASLYWNPLEMLRQLGIELPVTAIA